jgi:hypothetical protein
MCGFLVCPVQSGSTLVGPVNSDDDDFDLGQGVTLAVWLSDGQSLKSVIFLGYFALINTTSCHEVPGRLIA